MKTQSKSTISQRMSGNIYQRLVFSILKNMRNGALHITLPSGEETIIGNNQSPFHAYIIVKDDDFFKRIVYSADIGMGEAYVDGLWETPSIKDVISFFIINMDECIEISGGRKKTILTMNFKKAVNRIGHLLRDNSLNGSRKNIEEHYDLSNELYKRFLDPTLTYSSAFFTKDNMTLEQAQIAKYDRLCAQLQLSKDDHLLEIGTGWGGFSLHAATKYGCRITSYTISQEQHTLATERIKKAGIEDKVKVVLDDYRNISGQFDKIVSIEMMEAIGDKYLKTFFKKCHESLKPKGLMAFQVICSPSSRYAEFKKGVDWIQKHIFPGTLLPSLRILTQHAVKQGAFDLYNLHDMGLDYAQTLNHWRTTFNKNFSEIETLGFDTRFKRKWNYYLAYCEAAFATKNITVYQMTFSRPNNMALKY